uniref:Uncharacterized protein n=1 Tax=Vespula pensylvanica TaxID=30213 RepID=A0A834NZ66_VESPE|nr:hypothetical protein H0235_009359 [Vespula pensylvanica]
MLSGDVNPHQRLESSNFSLQHADCHPDERRTTTDDVRWTTDVRQRRRRPFGFCNCTGGSSISLETLFMARAPLADPFRYITPDRVFSPRSNELNDDDDDDNDDDDDDDDDDEHPRTWYKELIFGAHSQQDQNVTKQTGREEEEEEEKEEKEEKEKEEEEEEEGDGKGGLRRKKRMRRITVRKINISGSRNYGKRTEAKEMFNMHKKDDYRGLAFD